jgi:hypothetical protein
MDVSDFLARLDAVDGRNTRWQAACPAHNDSVASLSITQADDQRILVKCHAGCSTEEVVEAMGLAVKDLFPGRRVVETYAYLDERGDVLYEIVRFEPKDFRARRPDPSADGWIWDLEGCRRVPYQLPRLLEDTTSPVFLVEGEKDVERLLREGVLATTVLGGAGKWRPEYESFMAGRDVVVVPDNDEPGRNHAEHVAAALSSVASSVKILDLPNLPEKGDVSDWLDRGGDVQELDRRATQAKVYAPAEGAKRRKFDAFMTASSFTAQFGDERVEWVVEPLVARGAVTLMAAPRGVGKTMVSTGLAFHVAQQGSKVGYIDRENPRPVIVERFTHWGADGLPPTLFIIDGDNVPALWESGEWQYLIERKASKFDLLVVESYGALTAGAGDNDADKHSRAIDLLVRCARQGPGLLVPANTTKRGQHIRYSGIIEDRADLSFEIRNATGTEFTNDEWWMELDTDDVGSWGKRASRRRGKTRYRLAFVPSKFRLGAAPDPFVYEIDVTGLRWALGYGGPSEM